MFWDARRGKTWLSLLLCLSEVDFYFLCKLQLPMWRWNVLTQGSLTVCCLERKQQPDILYSYTVCVLYILQKTLKFCNIKRLWVVVCLFSFTLFCFALVYFAVTFLAPSPITSANKTDIDLLHFPTIFFPIRNIRPEFSHCSTCCSYTSPMPCSVRLLCSHVLQWPSCF